MKPAPGIESLVIPVNLGLKLQVSKLCFRFSILYFLEATNKSSLHLYVCEVAHFVQEVRRRIKHMNKRYRRWHWYIHGAFKTLHQPPLSFVHTLSILCPSLLYRLIISSIPLLILSLPPPSSTVVFSLIKLDSRVGGISVFLRSRWLNWVAWEQQASAWGWGGDCEGQREDKKGTTNERGDADVTSVYCN